MQSREANLLLSYVFDEIAIKNLAKESSKIVFKGTFSLMKLRLTTTPLGLRPLSFFLRGNSLSQALTLVDIACVDTLRANSRFNVGYLFFSLRYNQRFVVSLRASETLTLPSLSLPFANQQRVFASSSWLEREVWDLHGIYFNEHGDLRRILTDYGFSGHPLRKDFPLTGFYELVYNDAEGRVSSAAVELSQEFRVFSL